MQKAAATTARPRHPPSLREACESGLVLPLAGLVVEAVVGQEGRAMISHEQNRVQYVLGLPDTGNCC